MTIGAVHGDDVRVPHARQLACFVQNVSGRAAGGFAFEKLEGDGMIQPRVLRLVHLAECALADLSEQDEMTPLAELSGDG